jgi:hypothetical protein
MQRPDCNTLQFISSNVLIASEFECIAKNSLLSFVRSLRISRDHGPRSQHVRINHPWTVSLSKNIISLDAIIFSFGYVGRMLEIELHCYKNVFLFCVTFEIFTINLAFLLIAVPVWSFIRGSHVLRHYIVVSRFFESHYSISTRLRPGRYGIRISVRTRVLYILHYTQSGSGANPSLCSMTICIVSGG